MRLTYSSAAGVRPKNGHEIERRNDGGVFLTFGGRKRAGRGLFGELIEAFLHVCRQFERGHGLRRL